MLFPSHTELCSTRTSTMTKSRIELNVTIKKSDLFLSEPISLGMVSLFHMLTDQNIRPKRNYVRRKRYLAECAKYLRNVLEIIHRYREERVTEDQLNNEAYDYARSVESACWYPQLHLTPEGYRNLMLHKTKDLGAALLAKTVPLMEYNRILADMALQQQPMIEAPAAPLPPKKQIPVQNGRNPPNHKPEMAIVFPAYPVADQLATATYGFDPYDEQYQVDETRISQTPWLDERITDRLWP